MPVLTNRACVCFCVGMDAFLVCGRGGDGFPVVLFTPVERHRQRETQNTLGTEPHTHTHRERERRSATDGVDRSDQAAYSYYNVAKTVPLKDLMNDALTLAKIE